MNVRMFKVHFSSATCFKIEASKWLQAAQILSGVPETAVGNIYFRVRQI